MIRSMTGFGESSASFKDLSVWVRISSVNSRFLDINVKLPVVLNVFEPDVIKFINERVMRGKVNVVSWVEGENKSIIYRPVLDRDLLISYAEILEQATGILWGEPQVTLGELAQLEIVTLREKEEGKEILGNLLFKALDEALKKLNETRSREGKILADEIRKRIRKINASIKKLYKLKALQEKELRNTWETKLMELLQGEIDQNLIVREASQFVMRKDFTEELVRLESHIEFLAGCLREPPPCGSKLNFILQEASREITTLSSKAENKEVSRHAIEIKEELERIREQVQNIE